MAVRDPVCSIDGLSTELVVTEGETLVYEVAFKGGAEANFAIVDQRGSVILGSQDPPDPDGVYRKRWPADPDGVEAHNEVNHVLGMHFVTATEYAYRIVRKAREGKTIAVLKSCTYTSDPHDSTDQFFTPFRVSTR